MLEEEVRIVMHLLVMTKNKVHEEELLHLLIIERAYAAFHISLEFIIEREVYFRDLICEDDLNHFDEILL